MAWTTKTHFSIKSTMTLFTKVSKLVKVLKKGCFVLWRGWEQWCKGRCQHKLHLAWRLITIFGAQRILEVQTQIQGQRKKRLYLKKWKLQSNTFIVTYSWCHFHDLSRGSSPGCWKMRSEGQCNLEMLPLNTSYTSTLCFFIMERGRHWHSFIQYMTFVELYRWSPAPLTFLQSCVYKFTLVSHPSRESCPVEVKFLPKLFESVYKMGKITLSSLRYSEN